MNFYALYNADGSDISFTPDDVVRKLFEMITDTGYFMAIVVSTGRNFATGYKYTYTNGDSGMSGFITTVASVTGSFSFTASYDHNTKIVEPYLFELNRTRVQ